MKKVYISGPMKGFQDSNFPAFHTTALALRSKGYTVVNPAEIEVGKPEDHESHQSFYNACLRADIKALCDCEAIAMMPGWEKSSGAHLELHIAHRVGLEVLHVDAIINGNREAQPVPGRFGIG